MCRSLSLGSVSIRNLFFSGHYIPICWPYYTPHFLSIHYILKHRDANIQIGKSLVPTLTVIHVLPQALCTGASYVFQAAFSDIFAWELISHTSDHPPKDAVFQEEHVYIVKLWCREEKSLQNLF